MRAWGSVWPLEFHLAGDPPAPFVPVLATDGRNMGIAVFAGGRYHWQIPGAFGDVLGWSELPHPLGCLEDLLRERAGCPKCRVCGERMMRWGWWGAESEPFEWWYCMRCDLEGHAPYFQVHPTRGR